MVVLGKETMVACCKPDANGRPMFSLPGRANYAVPYLAYGPDAYLGRVLEQWQKQEGNALHLERVYETDMAEGLKAMALEGLGVAFLPESAIKRELESGKLAELNWGVDFKRAVSMEIRAYRERHSTRRLAKPVVQALWDYLNPPT
jgi:DNA-binding transcriptional LysR family regulator